MDWLLSGAVGGKPHRQFPSCVSCMHPSILPCLQGLQSVPLELLCPGARTPITHAVRRFLLQNPSQCGNTGTAQKDFLNDPRWQLFASSLCGVSSPQAVKHYRQQIYHLFLLVQLLRFSSVLSVVNKHLLLGYMIYLQTQNLPSTFLLRNSSKFC